MTAVLILRPEPGASDSATRAEALGLEPVTVPIFVVRPLAWESPAPASVDALLLTSANAIRHGGGGLGRFTGLPCYCVGPATAAAARAAGFGDIRVGRSDGRAAIAMMVADRVASALHLSGRDHVGLADPAIRLERRLVYAAEPVRVLPDEAAKALGRGALVLLHSPRAAAAFAALIDAAGIERGDIALAAISAAAAEAAGEGWRAKQAAGEPRDEALLELAAKLCKTAADRETKVDENGL
ncbi:uroporphyrinogen-III synthase [Sphingosinicella sp. LY1275]|uniref:uroporphyrinogen-III synthase n=1 Tax=Sphingosinicella sp. LY1275 TaxID=3095379 RepID=UPI002ADEE4A5|nr:uroporphyrinogen-III synthase [Sphingosinicella sp. LY1275]MEA1014229.1 uroporphyrinogen-III synthase [Sphingosinicella sp. LY1275]